MLLLAGIPLPLLVHIFLLWPRFFLFLLLTSHWLRNKIKLACFDCSGATYVPLKNINLSFLKSLINSDFSSVNPMFLKHETAPINLTAGFSKQQIHGNLDLLTLNRSLKQFIRTLRFFNRNRGVLTIFVKDAHFSFLLNRILDPLLRRERLLVSCAATKPASLRSGRRRANPALLLDKEFSGVNYLNKFQQNKHHMISSIDLVQRIVGFGGYHAKNDTLSLKKQTYTALILRNALRVPLKPLKRTRQKKKIKRAVESLNQSVSRMAKSRLAKTPKISPAKIMVGVTNTNKKKKAKKAAAIKRRKVLTGLRIKIQPILQKMSVQVTNWGPFKKKTLKKRAVCLKLTHTWCKQL